MKLNLKFQKLNLKLIIRWTLIGEASLTHKSSTLKTLLNTDKAESQRRFISFYTIVSFSLLPVLFACVDVVADIASTSILSTSLNQCPTQIARYLAIAIGAGICTLEA